MITPTEIKEALAKSTTPLTTKGAKQLGFILKTRYRAGYNLYDIFKEDSLARRPLITEDTKASALELLSIQIATGKINYNKTLQVSKKTKKTKK